MGGYNPFLPKPIPTKTSYTHPFQDPWAQIDTHTHTHRVSHTQGYPMGTVYSIYMLRNYRNESKIQVMIGDQFSIDVASCDGPIRGGKGVQKVVGRRPTQREATMGTRVYCSECWARVRC